MRLLARVILRGSAFIMRDEVRMSDTFYYSNDIMLYHIRLYLGPLVGQQGIPENLECTTWFLKRASNQWLNWARKQGRRQQHES
jgi:hypothetical protein